MFKKIRFNYPYLLAKQNKKQILKKVSSIIDTGHFLNGKENKLLEKKLSAYFPGGFITNTASGHDALFLALKSLNLSSDDEVIYPVNSYPTAFPVVLSGSKSIPVDIDENGQIDPLEIKKKITNKTKVIIAVHLYGLVGNIELIKEIIRNKNILLIEDCAQAFGAKYQNQPVGTLGDIACFSFYPTKNLATLGDGGAIWTKHQKIYAYLQKAIKYGEEKKYKSEFFSGHSRLPEIQAGITNIYFEKIDKNISLRRKLYIFYISQIKKAHLSNCIRVLESDQKSIPAPHLLIIKAEYRNELKKYLAQKGIETFIHYPYSPHLITAFSLLNCRKGDFPRTEKLSKKILSLPFHPFLSKTDIKLIITLIKNYYHV